MYQRGKEDEACYSPPPCFEIGKISSLMLLLLHLVAGLCYDRLSLLKFHDPISCVVVSLLKSYMA